MLLRHVVSMCLGTCFTAGMLAAADLPSKLATPGLAKLSQEQFQRMLFRALEAAPPKVAHELGQVSSPQRECAIPLLESRISNAERFQMPQAPIVGGVVDPIGAAPAVAACPRWNAGK